MERAKSELMDEERIACEAESDWLWMEVEGLPQAYGLHFIVRSGRRCEGSWPATTVPALLVAASTLRIF